MGKYVHVHVHGTVANRHTAIYRKPTHRPNNEERYTSHNHKQNTSCVDDSPKGTTEKHRSEVGYKTKKKGEEESSDLTVGRDAKAGNGMDNGTTPTVVR